MTAKNYYEILLGIIGISSLAALAIVLMVITGILV
jgi:hypothetical protein